jgi:hypothetical protein
MVLLPENTLGMNHLKMNVVCVAENISQGNS